MLLVGKLFVDLLGKHTHHNDKYDGIEEQDGKDGSQECTKEHISIANEAAGGKKVKYLYALLKCMQH